MQHSNSIIQSTAIDLLQVIVARGELEHVSVDAIEAAVIGKLYFCIHIDRLDLQNKLLHILHSLLSASTSNWDSSAPGNRNMGSNDSAPEDQTTQEGLLEGQRTHTVDPLLLSILVDGISTLTNRPVLQHWLDFVLMAVPQFQPMLQVVVNPLNDCVCRQLRLALADILQASRDRDDVEDIASAATDAEFIMLLNALERLVQLSLVNLQPNQEDEDSGAAEKPPIENSGLLGYVSNVFGSDNVTDLTADQVTVSVDLWVVLLLLFNRYTKACSPGYRSLRESIHVLYSIWATLAWSKPSSWSSKDDSLSMIYSRTRVRCRRVLEHLFRMQSAEVLESVIDCWSRESGVCFALHFSGLSSDKQAQASSGHDSASFELVDVLISSAQNAVHMICESITCRISGIKKRAVNSNL